jgi:hypothetical protein
VPVQPGFEFVELLGDVHGVLRTSTVGVVGAGAVRS